MKSVPRLSGYWKENLSCGSWYAFQPGVLAATEAVGAEADGEATGDGDGSGTCGERSIPAR
jgi:hypothetical protein